MPFALRWDRENDELDLIVKTVMRKKDFKTSNKEFTVEAHDPEFGDVPDVAFTNVNDTQEIKTYLNNMPHVPRVKIEKFRQRVEEPHFQKFLKKYMTDHPDEPQDMDFKAVGPNPVTTNAPVKGHHNEEVVNEESSIWKFNKEDPNNPEVLIQGYGRLMLNQIEASVVRKLAELTKMAERGDFEQIQSLLDKDVMQTMMKAIVDTKAELQATRKRGGPKSRGIKKESILDIIGESKIEEFELNELNIRFEEEVKEKQEKKDPLIKAFDPKTARAMMMLRAKYPQADNILSALLADVEDNEKDGDITDSSQDYKMDKLTKEVDILQKEIKLLKRKQTNETGGVGKIVPGVNTTVDVGPDEIKKQAAKYGNAVDKDGVPKKTYRK
jgi:hypothetical protein